MKKFISLAALAVLTIGASSAFAQTVYYRTAATTNTPLTHADNWVWWDSTAGGGGGAWVNGDPRANSTPIIQWTTAALDPSPGYDSALTQLTGFGTLDVRGIVFNGVTASTFGALADEFIIGSSGITITGANNQTITAKIQLSTSQTWNTNGRILTLNPYGNKAWTFYTNGNNMTFASGTLGLNATNGTFLGGGKLIVGNGTAAVQVSVSNYLQWGASGTGIGSPTLQLNGVAGFIATLNVTNDANKPQTMNIPIETVNAARDPDGYAHPYSRISTNGGGTTAVYTMAGKITGDGALGINPLGDVTFVLTADNDFKGAFVWLQDSNYGLVQAGSPTAFGLGSLVIGRQHSKSSIGTLDSVGGDLGYFKLTGNTDIQVYMTRFMGINTFDFAMPLLTIPAHSTGTVTNSITTAGKELIFSGGIKDIASGTLTFSGNLNETTNVAAVTRVSGIISNATNSGLQHIVADGSKLTPAAFHPTGGITLILDAKNTYTGTTTARNGARLVINGDNSLATGNVVIEPGTVGFDSANRLTTLSGIGTIGGNTSINSAVISTVTYGAVLSPGYQDAGILTFKGNLTMQANTILRLTSPDVSAAVKGTLSLGATWTLELMPHANWLAGTEDDKILVLGFAALGTETLPTTFTNNTGIAGIGTQFVAGEGLYLTGVMSAIPEPAAFALLALGAVAIAALRRSRKKS